jgi:hypothetical protein
MLQKLIVVLVLRRELTGVTVPFVVFSFESIIFLPFFSKSFGVHCNGYPYIEMNRRVQN